MRSIVTTFHPHTECHDLKGAQNLAEASYDIPSGLPYNLALTTTLPTTVALMIIIFSIFQASSERRLKRSCINTGYATSTSLTRPILHRFPQHLAMKMMNVQIIIDMMKYRDNRWRFDAGLCTENYYTSLIGTFSWSDTQRRTYCLRFNNCALEINVVKKPFLLGTIRMLVGFETLTIELHVPGRVTDLERQAQEDGRDGLLRHLTQSLGPGHRSQYAAESDTTREKASQEYYIVSHPRRHYRKRNFSNLHSYDASRTT